MTLLLIMNITNVKDDILAVVTCYQYFGQLYVQDYMQNLFDDFVVLRMVLL